MYKPNWPIVLDCVCAFLFWDEDNCRLIKEIEVRATVVVESINSSNNVPLDDRLEFFEEQPSEAIRPWGFITR